MVNDKKNRLTKTWEEIIKMDNHWKEDFEEKSIF